MPIDRNALEKAIKRAFPVTHLEIHDVSSGCGDSYSIVLVSEVRTPSFACEYTSHLDKGISGKDYVGKAQAW